MMNSNYLDDLKKCSRCGGCQAHCPLFLETGREAMVARGKIELIENLAAGKLQWNDKLAELFSTCLLCGSCTANCPNGVGAEKLVRAARNDLVASRGLPLIKRNIFHHLLTYNGRLNAMGRLLSLYQKTGLQKLIRASRVLGFFPHDLAEIETLLPKVPGGTFRNKVPVVNKVNHPRLKVAYFTGCVTNLLYHHVGFSVLKVLQSQGIEVIIPEQWCCGVPAFASGDFKTGCLLAARNIEAFQKLQADYIVCDCASCLSAWLEYPEFVESEKAGQLVAKVMDISRFLVEILDIKLDPPDLGIKVTYHDPCHLKNTPGGKTAPRELLRRLGPGCQYVEMELADRCCGSAGSFNLSHYRLSQKVASHKVKSVLKSQADVVTSGCPSCLMQLEHGLREYSETVQVMHVVELVWRCSNKGGAL